MRIKPNTTYKTRVKPGTIYSRPREESCKPLTWDNAIVTFDTTEITFDANQYDCGVLNSIYTRPRYGSYVEDITGANVFDLSGNLVQGISGNKVNKIDTVYK